jgi:integrase
MARRKLTDLSIKALKAKDKYYEMVDTSGLRLGVQPLPSATKSFLTRYRRPVSKKPAKLTHGTISLAAARVAHAEALRKLAEGIDPGADKQRAKAEARQLEADRRADTLDKHARAFLDFQVRRVRKATHDQQRHVLRDIALPAWGPSRAISDIRRRDVIELTEQVATDRPVMANRAAAVLHRFFRWLTERDVLAANPVSGVKRPTKEQARERILSPAEIQSLWHALDIVGGPVAAAAKMALLTGQRRSECVGLSRSELDGDTWLLPGLRTKNKKPHAVPLSRQTRELIAQQPLKPDGPFIFSSDGSKPIGGFSHLKREVGAHMQAEKGWVWHDLRRTTASGMQRLGVRTEVIERCLNHRSGVYRGVSGVYQVDPLSEETRDALQRWGDFIESVVKGEAEPGKVVTLRRS